MLRARRARLARGAPAELDDGDVLPSDSHYELLEVPPTASFEDIRRANRRIRDVYGAESIAVCGLYDPASLEAVHRRLDLAYTTLMDAAKRKDYDLELFPDGVPMPVAPPTPTAIAPPPRAAGEDRRSGDARGAAADARDHRRAPSSPGRCCARSARRSASSCARSPSARRSAWRTCRRSRARSSRKLPAPVYVRGFLAEYARALGLDAERVKQTYLDALSRRARPAADADEPDDDRPAKP